MTAVLTLVINLDRSPERLEQMRKKLMELALKWERLPAVDGSKLNMGDPTLLNLAEFHRKHGKPPLPGELGCYLSHVQAMKRMLDSDAEYALILEDDVELGKDLPEVICAALRCSDDWDVLKLSGIHSGHPLLIKPLLLQYHLAVTLTSYTGASCYLVKRSAAKVLIQTLIPMTLPYDLAYDRGWETGLKIRMVQPPPCQHSFAMGSELHPKGVIRKNFHWSKRIKTYAWRISNDINRFAYGLSQYILHIKR